MICPNGENWLILHTVEDQKVLGAAQGHSISRKAKVQTRSGVIRRKILLISFQGSAGSGWKAEDREGIRL